MPGRATGATEVEGRVTVNGVAHDGVFHDHRGNGNSPMNEITADNFTIEWLVRDHDELRIAWGLDRMTVHS